MHPRAIKAAQALLGPNVVLMSSAVITKYPTNIKKENYKGDFVGWHQDMKYWGLTNMKPNSRIKLASMWLAIDEVYSPFMNKKCMLDEMTMRKNLEFAIFLNHVNPPHNKSIPMNIIREKSKECKKCELVFCIPKIWEILSINLLFLKSVQL